MTEGIFQLLGGMIIWATRLYCGTTKPRFRKDDAPPVALDITLAQFGFGKAVSSDLQTRVARQMALCPLIAFAQKELIRQGVDLNVKAIKRITYQCGDGLLALRRHRIKLLRQKKLKASKELAGKRVSLQIDGGRMKIRGEMTLKAAFVEPRRTFAADWREPKLMTIFIR